MPNPSEILEILTALVAIGNTIALIYIGIKKTNPEIKHIEAEERADIAETAHSLSETAVMNTTLLKERLEEVKKDLDIEKRARRDDADYFRRRIKDVEKESRDNRLWAARLAKQVIEAGKIPVPFISSLTDTDPLITAISKEQIELEKARDSRQAELGKEETK